MMEAPPSVKVQLVKYAWINYENKLVRLGFKRGIDVPLDERQLLEVIKLFTKKSRAIKQSMLNHYSLFQDGLRKRVAIIRETRNIELDPDYPRTFNSLCYIGSTQRKMTEKRIYEI